MFVHMAVHFRLRENSSFYTPTHTALNTRSGATMHYGTFVLRMRYIHLRLSECVCVCGGMYMYVHVFP